MKNYAVITGDVSGFTKLDDKQRKTLVRDTEKLLRELAPLPEDSKMFRGDSYQLLQPDVTTIVKESLLLWCWFRSHSLSSAALGARMAIGIGKVAYRGESVLDSDGEAFHLSGRTFDKQDKKEMISIHTPDEALNETFAVILLYINRIIAGWSVAQARLVYLVLRFPDDTQGQLAERLKSSQPAVARRLATTGLRD